MNIYQRFNALQQAAVQKPAAKLKKKNFACIGARGFACASPHLPHKGRGMCSNCFQADHYYKAEHKAHAASPDSTEQADQATLRRQWYVEAGHNAREAARRNLPAGANFHVLAKRLADMAQPGKRENKREVDALRRRSEQGKATTFEHAVSEDGHIALLKNSCVSTHMSF